MDSSPGLATAGRAPNSKGDGHESGLLAAQLIATSEICAKAEAVIVATTPVNMMKGYEHKIWEP